MKKKKINKEVRGDQRIKGCESQILKSRFKSTLKISWNETWKIVEDYKALLFSNEKGYVL